jgi:nicotinate-nucleotide adenylyltransferase
MGILVNLRSSLWRGRKIGLLGGSFNPAHQGHVMISQQALCHLGLDEVWWLVSPQNPLKSARDMAPEATRMAQAGHIARHPKIRIADIEQQFGTRYTAQTLEQLRLSCPQTNFVWLMGADNVTQLPQWRDWTSILNTVPIAIFGRPDYSLGAMTSMVAKRYGQYRLNANQAQTLVSCAPPAWTFIHHRHDPISATLIRQH